ncbi:MAG TPA: VOC family protein [Patescibacteria group bacterium]|nr:VOC family protein [Patescibacteria group bacterium]
MTSNPAIVPELVVTDITKSLVFYVEILGFSIKYQREEEGFAYLILGEAHLMLDQIDKGRTWKTGEFEIPLGRGINFQIEVPDIESLLGKLKEKEIKLFMEVEEKWYRREDHEVGNKQFIVQDPDGYLLRFFQDLGKRPLTQLV